MKIETPKYWNKKHLKFAGIYFLLRRKKIVYIGQTCNIINRLGSHGMTGKYDSVRIIECRNSKMRKKYEKRWIIKFRPKHNKTHLKIWIGPTVCHWGGKRKEIEINRF